jgi:hypothetical protein
MLNAKADLVHHYASDNLHTTHTSSARLISLRTTASRTP